VANEFDLFSDENLDLLSIMMEEEGIETDVSLEIGPRADQSAYPLSFSQMRLWFLDRWEPDNPTYNIPGAFRLEGDLEVGALCAAFDTVLERHEVLRASLREAGGKPAQQIEEAFHLDIPVDDLTGEDPENRARRAHELIRQESVTPFDLSRPPLIRVRLIALGKREHLLSIVVHHIVFDGWSLGVLMDELGTHYRAAIGASAEGLAPLPLQFADYADWQRRMFNGGPLQDQLAYWTERLSGELPVMEIPGDRPRPAVRTTHGRLHRFSLPAELSARAERAANVEKATLFSLLTAVYSVMLGRLTGLDDILVGTPVANRTRAELEPMIGCFANTVVLRTALVDEHGRAYSFRELVRRVQSDSLDAYSNQELPFDMLVESLSPGRNLRHTPIFQTVFVFQNLPEGDAAWPGLSLSGVESDSATAKFDLTLNLTVGKAGLKGFFEYNTDIFDEATIRRYETHFATLLTALLDQPDVPVDRAPMISEEERSFISRTWGRAEPSLDVTEASCLHRHFMATASRFPYHPALHMIADDQNPGGEMTYAELDSATNRLAHALRERGVGPEVLVAVCMQRSLDTVIAILGILKAGGAYLPIDPAQPEDRLRLIIDDSLPGMVLTHGPYARLFDGHERMVLLDDPGLTADSPDDDPAVTVLPDQTAYVIYTSGTTGKPKGSLITHFNAMRLFTATDAWFGFDEDDVWTLFHSFAFDFSVWEIWGALLNGGRLEIIPYWVSRNPVSFYNLLVKRGVTVLNQTPSAFRQLIAAEEEVAGEPSNLALRYVIFGGEALDLQSLHPWFFRHGDQRPRLVNMYGITETTVHVTYREIEMQDVVDGASSVIGRAIPDLALCVLDRHLEPLPIGAPGEILVGGAGLSRGYLGRPGLTATRFIPNPYGETPGERLYRTGDLAAFLANGDTAYRGRIDQQVKLRGFRIELGEIEAAITSHPRVVEAVVLLREDMPGHKILVAYLVTKDGEPIEELRGYLAERIPDYMVPAGFVNIEAMPLTGNGKLDRKALPEPDFTESRSGERVQPSTQAEVALAEVWADTLGLEDVGIDDNFFELGGDSIRSVEIISGARSRGFEISLREVFQYQTIRELAASAEPVYEDEGRTDAFSLVSEADRARFPDDVVDAYPISAMQKSMLYHMAREPDRPIYHNVDSFRLTGPFEPEAMQAAVDLVVARHPILRTGFHMTGFSEPLQLVHQTASLPVGWADIREETRARQQALIRTYIEDQLADRFDVTRAPLLRFFMHRREDNQFQFTLTECHCIFDGWSLTASLNEIYRYYMQIVENGEAEPEGDLPTSFADFIRAERDSVASEDARAFWRDHLEDSPNGVMPRWPLPVSGDPYAKLGFWITQEDVDGLNRLAALAGAPLKSVLLAVHMKVLNLLNGSREVVTNLASNGRLEREGGAEVRGLFLNTLPFRTKIPRWGSWVDVVRGIFRTESEWLAHRRFPLAVLQQEHGELKPDIVFNYISFHRMSEEIHPGFAIEEIEYSSNQNSYPISVNFTASDAFWTEQYPMRCVFQYNGTQFPTAQIEAMAEYYQRVMQNMIANPEGLRGGFEYLDDASKRRIIDRVNQTRAFYPNRRGLAEVFEEVVAFDPDHIALRYMGQTVTYGALDARADKLARQLREKGVGTDMLVGLCARRSADMIVGMLAILKAGGAYVPLDPSYPNQRLRFMVEESRLEALVIQKDLVSELPIGADRVIHFDDIGPGETEESPTGAHPSQTAYVMFTSGSTGEPKGVMVTQQGVINLVFNSNFDRVTPDSVFLIFAPISFDASTFEIWSALLNGATLAIYPPGTPSLQELGSFIREEYITNLFLTTGFFHQLVREQRQDLFQVKTMYTGGDRLSAEVVRLLREQYPDTPLLNCYGPTEGTVMATTYRIGPELEFTHNVPIGKPVSNGVCYIVDDRMRQTPIGSPGELVIGGDGLARCYLRQPALTAERFIPNPFATNKDQNRLYRTGDRARFLPDGEIDFMGRIDRQVKIRGFRIEPGEVESAINHHPEVEHGLVIIRDDASGQKQLVAYYTSRHETLEPTVLKAFLKNRLPPFMIPGALVPLDEFPLTPNQKVDRGRLPEPTEGLDSGFRPPITPTQEVLALIWESLLGVPNIGLGDNFFDKGGHSLLATQLIIRIREELEVDLPMNELFDAANLEALAYRIDQRVGGSRMPVPRLGTHGSIGSENPLSFAQQRMWLIDRMQDNHSAYHVPLGLHLSGRLDRKALYLAIEELVARHEVFRTRFEPRASAPVAIIDRRIELEPEMHDLSETPEESRETAALELFEETVNKPFDLSRGPLIRPILVKLDETRHDLLLHMHHIVVDGWSLGILIRELRQLYSAFVRGENADLPQPALHYSDFTAWQREWMAGDVLETQLAFWKDQFADIPPRLALPVDPPHPHLRTGEGAMHRFTIDAETTRSLRSLSRAHNATLFMTLLAGFETLLYRYTEQVDLVVGVPVANRNHPGLENIVGFFVNTLALRGYLEPEKPFTALLDQVKKSNLAGFKHQDLPFEMLVDALPIEREVGSSPLFQVTISLQSGAKISSEPIEGLHMEGFDIPTAGAKYDLTLVLIDDGEVLDTGMEYNTDVLDAPSAERLAQCFTALLRSIADRADQPLYRLPMMSEEEAEHILHHWNQTATDYPRDSSVIASFEARVAKDADAFALVDEAGLLSYGQLNAAAGRTACALVDKGIRPGDRVALAMGRSRQFVIAMLAVLKAGATYVPLDPEYPHTRLGFILADTGTGLVICHDETIDMMTDLAGEMSRALEVTTVAGLDDPDATPMDAVRSPGSAPVYIMYTSGSTGEPKGVVITNRNILRLAHDREYVALREGQNVGHISNVSFDASTFELWTALLWGGRLVVVSKSQLVDAEELGKVLDYPGIDYDFITVALFNMFAGAEPSLFRRFDTLLVGGDKLDPIAIRKVMAAGPPKRLLNGYGPTESTTFAAWYELKPSDGERTHIPIGKPIANTTLYVLDRWGRPVPYGVPGRLMIGGDGLAQGYLGSPALTASRFLPDPYGKDEGGRLYDSGDRVKRDPDGNVVFIGRTDFQVKIRGFRIEPGEVETVLGECPLVRQVVVIAREDKAGEKNLTAYVVPVEGKSVTPADLREVLRNRLPSYMIPAHFVVMEALPLTPNGKVDRGKLPAPVDADTYTGKVFEPPVTTYEVILGELWCELLDREKVSRHDHYFELGGSSLAIARLQIRLRDTLDLEIPLIELFEKAVLREQAAMIEDRIRGERGVSLPALEARSHTGPIPLSHSQERLWFLDRMFPGGNSYNMPFGRRLTGPFDLGALERALDALVVRHESLRTTFPEEEDGVVAAIATAQNARARLRVEDFSDHGPERAEQLALARCREETERPFELQAGPLFRANVFRIADEDHVLLLNMHHIISDGWSIGVLMRELDALYDGFVSGREVHLEPLPIQYADYAVWQRGWLTDENLDALLDFWRKRFDIIPTLELPTDRPRPEVAGDNGGLVSFSLSANATAKIHEISRIEGATVFMTLLAVFKLLMARFSGQWDLVVGTPVANRSHYKTEPLIGFFVNNLPLRTQMTPMATFRDILGGVRETVLRALAHQEVPFAFLVSELNPNRDQARNPLFQVNFSLVNIPLPTERLGGLEAVDMTLGSVTAKFDLNMAMAEVDGILGGQLEYNADLFDTDTARSYTDCFIGLVDELTANPDKAVGSLSLMGEGAEPPKPVRDNTETVSAPAIYVAPSNELEEKIAVIWAEGLEVEKVGVNDNFFDLGGSSLLLPKLNKRIKEELEVELSIVDMFQNPTVASLAALLASKDTSPAQFTQSRSRAEERAARMRDRKNRRNIKRRR